MDWTQGEMTEMAAEVLRKADSLHTALKLWANTTVSRDLTDGESTWDLLLDLQSLLSQIQRRMEKEWEKEAPCMKKAGIR